MKEFIQVLKRFIPPYKKYLVLTVLFNILSALLNIFSFMAIIPILNILFQTEGSMEPVAWIPWNEIRPETFGLGSIRQGIEKLLTKKIIIK